MNALPPGYQQALMQQMLGGQTGMPGSQSGMPGAGGQGQGGVSSGMPLGPSFGGPDMTNGQVQGIPSLPPAQPGDAGASICNTFINVCR